MLKRVIFGGLASVLLLATFSIGEGVGSKVLHPGRMFHEAVTTHATSSRPSYLLVIARDRSRIVLGASTVTLHVR